MLRNLDQEFRGNEPPGELYSRRVRNGAVILMEKACGPPTGGVKTGTPA